MHQSVLRHLKQRVIAKKEAQDCPGGGRGEHDRAQNRRVHVAHYFFEGKQNGRHRCIEGRGNGCGGSNRNQSLYLFGAQSERSAENRSDSGTYLDRWSLSAQRYPARERSRRAEE